MKKTLTTLAIAACAFAAHAQGLQTEITVDRVVEPSQRNAVRPDFLPVINEQTGQAVMLVSAEYTMPGSIATCLSRLQSVAWADTIEHSSYRGYASIGYFPAVNIGANAGYRLIDKKNAILNVYGQHNGRKYSRDDVDMQRNSAAVGLDLLVHPMANSTLTASIGYRFGSELRPHFTVFQHVTSAPDDKYKYVITDDKTQKSNQITVDLGWTSRVGNFAYDLGFGYDHFGLTHVFDPLPDQKQSHVQFCAGAAMMRDDVRFLGLDIEGNFLNTDAFATDEKAGIVAFKPYANLGSGVFRAHLGLNVYACSGIESGMRLAPDIRISYAPLDKPVSAYFNLVGKREVTPMAKMHDIDPYVSFNMPCINLNIPYGAQVGLNLGRFSGFGIGIYGEFAHVDTYNVPIVMYVPASHFATPDAQAARIATYMPIMSNSWKVGATISYAHGDLFEIGANVEKGGSDNDVLTWYEWYDNASLAYKLYAKATPIKPLTVGIAYIGRTDRKAFNGYGDNLELDLGTLNDLSLSAEYKVTPQLTVFANLTNLLNSDYQLISALPAQGLSGLLGLSYKF